MLAVIFIVCYSIALIAPIVAILFVFPAISGAPYVAMSYETAERMVRNAKPVPGDRAVDLGSGDGRIVIAFAKAGIEAHGYEINPLLVWVSRRNIKKAGLKGRAFIYWKSLWRANLASVNVVTVYGITHMMSRLERKLQKELPRGARVVSRSFTFPNWKPAEQEGNVLVYEKT